MVGCSLACIVIYHFVRIKYLRLHKSLRLLLCQISLGEGKMFACVINGFHYSTAFGFILEFLTNWCSNHTEP